MPKDHEHRYIGSEKQEPVITRGSVNDAMHAAEVKIRAGWFDIVRSHPTVLVSEDAELLLLPQPRSLIDQLRGHVVVNVAHRTHGHASPYAIAGRLGRHPVRQMRELAHA